MIQYKDYYLYYLNGIDYTNIEKSEPFVTVIQITHLSDNNKYCVYYPDNNIFQWLGRDMVEGKYSYSIGDAIYQTVQRIQTGYDWWQSPYIELINKIVHSAQEAYVRVEKMREK
jgi:hypothetical protein